MVERVPKNIMKKETKKRTEAPEPRTTFVSITGTFKNDLKPAEVKKLFDQMNKLGFKGNGFVLSGISKEIYKA